MIALAGVVVLAVAGVGVAVLSATAARHPDRAAMLVVLAAAAGGIFALFVLLLGLTGIGVTGQGAPRTAHLAVRYSPPRLAAGISVAAAFLVAAAWLIRSGDWRSPDD